MMLWLCCFVAADLAKDWKRKTNAISVQYENVLFRRLGHTNVLFLVWL
jgi:hypothetical protein